MKKHIISIFALFMVAALIPETARSQDSGAGASEATDPTVPLAQLQLQNTFIPESFNSTGYSNQFIVQPVLPFTIDEDAYFPYHIIRPTIPVIAPTPDPDGPAGVQGGLGDTTLLDAFIHPLPELKTSWGIGYAANLPTATHEALGTREWELGPAVFATTKAVDKWLFGALCYSTFSLESDAYQVLAQPVAVRYLPNEMYTGWGDILWKVDDQNGDYNLPLSWRLGKVTEIGDHKLNVFIEPFYTPRGFHRTAGRSEGSNWGIKLNVTFLLEDVKLSAPILSRLCGGRCR